MTNDVLTAGGGVALTRAGPDDCPAVERLQRAAYALNRELLGVEPMPLQADYDDIFRDHEVWIKPGEKSGDVDAALILETDRPDDILIWSVSTAPEVQKNGLGHTLLKCAEQRARELGRDRIRLYTGQPLTHLVAWYSRHGYAVERIEEMADRTAVHMIKHLA